MDNQPRSDGFIELNNSSSNNNILDLLNPLPNDKLLDMTKLKAFVDDKLNVVTLHFFLTLSQASLGFYVSAVQVFENSLGKGEIVGNKQFLLFPQRFLPFCTIFHHFHQI